MGTLKLPLALTGMLVGALFLGSTELGLRSVGAFDPTELPDPYMGFPGSGPLYRKVEKQGQAIFEVSPNKLQRYRAQQFPCEKAAREFRVFCLGGSSVMSEHYKKPDGSFPNFLQLYLRALSTKRMARVINAGGAGTGSVQNLEVLREVVHKGADLIVLYPEGGEKNLIPPAPGGLLALRDEQSPARVYARRHLAELHTYCAARELFAAALPANPTGTRLPSAFSTIVAHALSKPFSEQTFSRLFELKQDRPPVLMDSPIPSEEIQRANARFRESLQEGARIAHEAGAGLLLVLPQHNLEHSFYLRFHITPEELRPGTEAQWRARYAEGLALKREGRAAAALPVLESIRELYTQDRDDILAYYIAQCHGELGRHDEELRELRAIYERHPMIRELRALAAEQGIPLVDPFDALLEAANGRVPGHDFFSDAYHPMPHTSRIIARTIAKAVEANGLLPGSQGFGTRRMQNCEKACERMLEQVSLPVHYRIFAAIRAKDYDQAVAIAQSMPAKRFYGSPVAPFYLGWALTRAQRFEDARIVFQELQQRFGDETLELPDLDTDEGLIIHAFQGDVFAIF